MIRSTATSFWIVTVVIAAFGAAVPSVAHAAIALGTANTSALQGGLVGYWTMDGARVNWRSGTVTDSSGSGYTGVPVSMSTTTSPVAGRIGGALRFNGINQYASVAGGGGLNNLQTGTISMWVKWSGTQDAGNTNFGHVLARQSDGVFSNNVIGLDASDPASAHVVWNPYAAGVTAVTSSVVAGNNRWRHVVITYTSGRHVMYIDGVVVGSGTTAGSMADSAAIPLSIGAWIGAGGGYSASAIDDVRIYSRELNGVDVALLYALGNTKVGAGTVSSSGWSIGMNAGLVVHWTFDGGKTNWATGTAQDSSGTGNTASLVLMSTTSSPVTGKIGGAFRFDGSTTQYAQVGGISSLGTANQPYTMSAWIRPTSANQTGDILHVSALSTGLGWCLSMVQLVSGQAKALSWIGSPVTVTGTTSMRPGQWYHVVNTWDATGGLRIYVNGALENSTAQGTFTASGAAVYVTVASPVSGAACTNDAGTGFNGSFDDVRIYSRSISPQEVYQLYKIGGVTLGQAGFDNSGKTMTLASGLISHWTFDGPRTNWTTGQVTDSSGLGNTGQVWGMSTSTTPVAGKIGQALYFDGVDAYMSTTKQYTNPNPYTISIWFKTTSASWHKLIGFENTQTGTGSGQYDRMIYMGLDGKIYYGSSVSDIMASSKVLTDGKWHLAVGTFAGTLSLLYIDGVLDNTDSSAAVTNYSGYWRVGGYKAFAWTNGIDGYFTGALDDARVYSRALSAQEVYQLYKGEN